MGNACCQSSDDLAAESVVETKANDQPVQILTPARAPSSTPPVDVVAVRGEAEKAEDEKVDGVDEGKDEKATTEPADAEAAAAEAVTVPTQEESKDAPKAAPNPVIIVFEQSGKSIAVQFSTAEFGFDYGQDPGGCCGPSKSKAPVKVKKVVPKKQPGESGVIIGAIVRRVVINGESGVINGEDIVNAEQLRDLLASAFASSAAASKAPAEVAPAAKIASALEPESMPVADAAAEVNADVKAPAVAPAAEPAASPAVDTAPGNEETQAPKAAPEPEVAMAPSAEAEAPAVDAPAAPAAEAAPDVEPAQAANA